MHKRITSALLTLLLAWTVGITNPAHADLNISDNPLFVSVSVPPNLMFTHDDSGSMFWSFMPDGIFGSRNTDRAKSSTFNAMYYDPNVNYARPVDENGDPLPEPSFTGAWRDGYAHYRGDSTPTVDLSSDFRPTWYYLGGLFFAGPPESAYYFVHDLCGNVNNDSCYSKVVVGPSSGPGGTDERQNFANWYSYYRNRIAAARAGIGRAFAQVPDNFRLGWGRINKTWNSSVDGANVRAIQQGVRQMDSSHRQDFYDWLYSTEATGGTPLRRSLEAVGQYFDNSSPQGPWSTTPGSGGGDDLACRQSFSILMSDGFWNGGNPSVGNADNSNGPTYTDSDGNPGGYTVADPFKDGRNNTLGDVAMEYWKNDLHPADNRVPNSTRNPAFWQHLVSYTVGFGVEGNVDPVTAFDAIETNDPIAWGNPYSNDAAKIDDLLHAAVNSRGDFFSAGNPDEFANELSSILADIIERASPTTGVSVSATRLTTGSLIYAAEFDSDEWTGELQALDAETGTVDKEATVELASKTPPGREIFTYDPANDTGLVFKPGPAAAIFPRLTASAPGDPEWTAENIINYVRGDDEPNGVTTFRKRAVMLGDIVNSRPVFSGARNEGWGTLDATYLDYIDGPKKDPDDCSAPCNREETVFIGANDGMLHAFDANTLEELFAYVPSTVHEKLHNLADPGYSHQFFVDGQVTVADAKISGSWGTYLVGTLGAGGRGIFALDVTEPQNFDETDVLWELSADDDPDIGFTFGDPVISRLEDGTWVAVFGNGYNSDDEKAILLVVDLKTGGDNVYKKLELDSGPDNGLSGLAGLRDFGSRKFLDRAYAGDLQGNMWRVDFNSSSQPVATLGGNGLLFTDADSRPITATPDIAANPSGGLMVYFGTGKLIEPGDPNTTDVERFYAVRDQGAGLVSAGDLGEITLSNGPSIPGQPPLRKTSSGAASAKGWFMKLKVGSNNGERVLDAPQVRFGNVKIDTFEPVDDPCTPGGIPRTYFVDALSGTGGLPFCNGCASLEGVSGAPLSAPVVIKPPGSGGSPSFGGYEDPASPTPPGSFPTPPAPPAAADTEAWCSELTIPLAGGGTDLTLGTICDGRNVWRQIK